MVRSTYSTSVNNVYLNFPTDIKHNISVSPTLLFLQNGYSAFASGIELLLLLTDFCHILSLQSEINILYNRVKLPP